MVFSLITPIRRNENSIETVREHKRQNEIITLPYLCSDTLIDEIIK